MDKIDREIVMLLQKDASLPVADIARKVGLSVTPCWRRIQKMEEDGIIRGRVALLDSEKIGMGMSVFVGIKTDQHNAIWLQQFADTVSSFPEVVEFYRMSGEVDYMLRVVVPDMASYDVFYKKLIGNIELKDVSSSFAMEEIKYTTALPLPDHIKP
ncbi:MAG: Lrp/AsnC family transcriptional regulator [Candidatus Puniceispirillaceae bacterium]